MRKLSLVALGAAAALTLAGCAPANSGATGGGDEEAKIRVWLVGTDTPDEARDYLSGGQAHDEPVRQ